jgi:hypothetical protein
MKATEQLNRLQNEGVLCNRVAQALRPRAGTSSLPRVNAGGVKGSAVLFLLTTCPGAKGRGFQPCLLLNKRSQQVLQPGDLCCPGGGVEKRDRLLSRLIRWPVAPLGRWPFWKGLKGADPAFADKMALLLTTGLRESWEEMRLNPFKVRFLEPLSEQRLVMFDRVIYPMAGWISGSQRLTPNWEVDRIVHLPLRRLLDHRNYGRYRLNVEHRRGAIRHKEDFPCFIHRGSRGEELLWGATFRITLDFLQRVFNFRLPDLKVNPVYSGRLGQAYLSGSLLDKTSSPQPLKMSEEDY